MNEAAMKNKAIIFVVALQLSSERVMHRGFQWAWRACACD
jgi:hypothetical protein